MEGGLELSALVFLTIAGTVLLAGLTAGPMGRLLGVRQPGRDGVAILGAEGVGLALARVLRESGVSATFLDSNPQNCRKAEEEGFVVVYGNAMEERTQRRARFELVGSVIALTPNQTVNSAMVSRARELFRVPQALVAVTQLDTGLASELVERKEAAIAFDGPHDLARWNVRIRRDDVGIEARVYEPPATDDGEAQPEDLELGERAMLLAVERNGKPQPMRRDLKLREGDRVWVAIHEPDRSEAEQRLAALGLSDPPAPAAAEAD